MWGLPARHCCIDGHWFYHIQDCGGPSITPPRNQGPWEDIREKNKRFPTHACRYFSQDPLTTMLLRC